ncbi:hypothetical protein N9112_01760 [bacterium]|jgi:hypothetical protein|nr:hypothetical protein [bacterium]
MISSLMVFLEEYGVWLVVASSISLIIGLLLLPFFLTRIPVDYFSHNHRHYLLENSRHPLIRLLITGLKNLLGMVFVVAGFLMLFLPGQGLVTLLVGLIIMNYPGKFALENWLIRRTFVLPAVNWLRVKYDHPPLLVSPGNKKPS